MKKFEFLLVATTILASIFVSPSIILADDTGANYSSEGVIEFEPGTQITDPVDPVDPENPIVPVDPTDPEKPIKPGTQGPLSIDFASNLDFGKQKITSKDEFYFAKPQQYKATEPVDAPIVEGPNFVQVSDNRGTESGWTLKVSQDGQFTSTTGKTLTGAKVTFKNGNIMTASESPMPSTSSDTFVLDPDGLESEVMAAKAGEGAGTYLMDWGTDADSAAQSIELAIPGATTKYAEQYTTSFNWILTDTPAN